MATIITNKQLERLSEMFRDRMKSPDFAGETYNMFFNICDALGLKPTKVDGVYCVVPDTHGELMWEKSKRCVEAQISYFQSLISSHNEEIYAMKHGFQKKDESRITSLEKANEFCNIAVKDNRDFIAEVDGGAK